MADNQRDAENRRRLFLALGADSASGELTSSYPLIASTLASPTADLRRGLGNHSGYGALQPSQGGGAKGDVTGDIVASIYRRRFG
jgi:hypothetical protein